MRLIQITEILCHIVNVAIFWAKIKIRTKHEIIIGKKTLVALSPPPPICTIFTIWAKYGILNLRESIYVKSELQ